MPLADEYFEDETSPTKRDIGDGALITAMDPRTCCSTMWASSGRRSCMKMDRNPLGSGPHLVIQVACSRHIDRSFYKHTPTLVEGCEKHMEVQPALALPNGLEVIGIEMRNEVLTITAVSTQMRPCCPLCSAPASRVHSCYCRQIADLPCSGQHVRLFVQVRKCFCEVPTCARKIFTERLTPFVEPWARVRKRLYQIV